jgi:hypothetical protein
MKLPAPVNGLSIQWVPAPNQSHFIMLHGIVLRIITDREEAVSIFNDLVANREQVLSTKEK